MKMKIRFFSLIIILLISQILLAEEKESGEKMEKELSPQFHHYLGIELNMQTWNLLSKNERSPEDNNRMLAFALASNYHWYRSPHWKPVNEQRGFWLIARVYTVLESKVKALDYANKCLELTQELSLKDFDLAYAYEAVARAYALNDDTDNFKKYKDLAISAMQNIENKEDKKYFSQDFFQGPWFEYNKIMEKEKK